MMKNKDKKGMQEIGNEDLEQASGGVVEAIPIMRIPESKIQGGNKGYRAYNPKNIKERKNFDTYKEALEYSKKMGW